ncbi:cytochrome P450 [Longispora sp. NPDC051575]|uniref:cytochrome P450 n=1 Tax=Longispora sp. NPDC051575 TaxID=3154943 RepID=UPI0034359CC2
MTTFHRYADVTAALADPRLVPVPAGPGRPGTMAWLRATVARFSAGDAHARRRALLESDLSALDPAALRTAAATAPGDPRHAVLRTLAAALGLAEPDAVAEAVTVAAGTYFGGEDPAADAAVAWLLPRMTRPGSGAPDGPGGGAGGPGGAGGQDVNHPAGEGDLPGDPVPTGGTADADTLEVAANRIGLLIQACDATAGLIANARRTGTGTRSADGSGPHVGVDDLLRETLRHDPPVPVTRRVAAADTEIGGVPVPAGTPVTLDIAAANRDPALFADPDTFDPARRGPDPLTFGGAPRVCPARAHALALAAGVLEGARTPSERTPS